MIVYLHILLKEVKKYNLHKVFLGLGTNLGDRPFNLRLANNHISKRCGSVIETSGMYISPAWGFASENEFYNQCLKIETHFTPDELIDELLSIEVDMGRVRESFTYSDRIMDIDVLFYDDLLVQTSKLLVPHPRIADRRFVLAPMTELAPNLIHPQIGKTMEVLLEDCKDSGVVRRI